MRHECSEQDRERWLRFCDAWVAIGLVAQMIYEAAPISYGSTFFNGAEIQHRKRVFGRMGIPAAEAK